MYKSVQKTHAKFSRIETCWSKVWINCLAKEEEIAGNILRKHLKWIEKWVIWIAKKDEMEHRNNLRKLDPFNFFISSSIILSTTIINILKNGRPIIWFICLFFKRNKNALSWIISKLTNQNVMSIWKILTNPLRWHIA